jgi:hypothetical protein
MVAVRSPIVTVPDLGADASFGATVSVTRWLYETVFGVERTGPAVMNGALLTAVTEGVVQLVAPAGGRNVKPTKA